MFGVRIAPLIIIQDHEVVFKVRLQKKKGQNQKKEMSKSVLESLHISEKNHFLGFTLSCVLVLTNFKVILGFLGLCCANWGWGRDQKTVLGSTHKYIVSTFDF